MNPADQFEGGRIFFMIYVTYVGFQPSHWPSQMGEPCHQTVRLKPSEPTEVQLAAPTSVDIIAGILKTNKDHQRPIKETIRKSKETLVGEGACVTL